MSGFTVADLIASGQTDPTELQSNNLMTISSKLDSSTNDQSDQLIKTNTVQLGSMEFQNSSSLDNWLFQQFLHIPSFLNHYTNLSQLNWKYLTEKSNSINLHPNNYPLDLALTNKCPMSTYDSKLTTSLTHPLNNSSQTYDPTSIDTNLEENHKDEQESNLLTSSSTLTGTLGLYQPLGLTLSGPTYLNQLSVHDSNDSNSDLAKLPCLIGLKSTRFPSDFIKASFGWETEFLLDKLNLLHANGSLDASLNYYNHFKHENANRNNLISTDLRKPKRIRTAFSPAQLFQLESAFEKNHYVIGQERKDLASDLGLSETQVKVWFQNRRTKFKRLQTDGKELLSNSACDASRSNSPVNDDVDENDGDEDDNDDHVEEDGDDDQDGNHRPNTIHLDSDPNLNQKLNSNLSNFKFEHEYSNITTSTPISSNILSTVTTPTSTVPSITTSLTSVSNSDLTYQHKTDQSLLMENQNQMRIENLLKSTYPNRSDFKSLKRNHDLCIQNSFQTPRNNLNIRYYSSLSSSSSLSLSMESNSDIDFKNETKKFLFSNDVQLNELRVD